MRIGSDKFVHAKFGDFTNERDRIVCIACEEVVAAVTVSKTTRLSIGSVITLTKTLELR